MPVIDMRIRSLSILCLASALALSACANAPGSGSGSPSVASSAAEATPIAVPLILFTRTLNGDDLETFTMGIDGSRQTELTAVDDCCGSWSPDGTILMVPDKLASSRLLPATLNVDGTGYAVHTMGGSQVTFGGISLDAAGQPDFTRSAVYLAEADGSRAEPITEPGAFTEAAAWSPNGDWIVFNKKSGPVGVKGSDLYQIHPDGSGLHAITTAGAAGESDQVGAGWSPDGTRLLFTVVPGGPIKVGDLWTVNVDGTGLTQLTDYPAQYWGYSWQPPI